MQDQLLSSHGVLKRQPVRVQRLSTHFSPPATHRKAHQPPEDALWKPCGRESDGCAPCARCIRPNTLSRPTPASEYRCAPPCLHGPPNPPPPCAVDYADHGQWAQPPFARRGQSTACAPGQIFATDFPRGNHADQGVHGRPISRYHHQAAGVLVQPVHDSSTRHQSCTGIAPQQRVEQCSAPVTGRRMHHKTRRLYSPPASVHPHTPHQWESARVGTLDSATWAAFPMPPRHPP